MLYVLCNEKGEYLQMKGWYNRHKQQYIRQPDIWTNHLDAAITFSAKNSASNFFSKIEGYNDIVCVYID
jgi:hypothetical protein